MILVQINQKHQHYILKVQYVVKSVRVMRWWERTSSLDTEGSRSIKRAVKDAFHLPHRKLDSRVTDGDSSIWQTYWRAEQRPGTGSGAGILGESGWHQEQACLYGGRDLTHTFSAPILLRSKRRLAGSAAPEKLPLSGDGFHVNGRFNRRCVTALLAHWAPIDPLLLVFN